MSTKKAAPVADTEKTAPGPDIVLDLNTAKCLYDLFHNVELADLHFKSCQATSFRTHVQSTYKAPNISAAFDKLNAAIKNSEGE